VKPAEFIAQRRNEAQRIHRGRLFRKYFLLILALVCGVLLISGGIGLYFSYQENKVALASVQREKALGAAVRFEDYIRQIEKQLAFAALPQLGAEGIEQRRIEFFKLQRVVPDVTDIAQIGADGRELLSVSRLKIEEEVSNRDRSKDPAFLEAKPKQTWFGPVYFRKETEPYMQIAVRSAAGGPVTVADVNLKFMWDVVTRIKIGRKGKAYVVDQTGHLVADPDIGLVLRKTDLSQLPQVRTAFAKDAEPSAALMAEGMASETVLTAYASIESLGWKVFVEQPVTEVYATLNAAIIRTAALLVAGLLFSALTAIWLARSMVRPIRTLQEGAARIGAGELEQTIEVKTGDELEALADQFNQMSAQLRESYASLERKVEERTAALQQALEFQGASGEILASISGSIADSKPVFDAIVRNLLRLFGTRFAVVQLLRDGKIEIAAVEGETGFEKLFEHYPRPIDDRTMGGHVMLSGEVLQVTPVLGNPAAPAVTVEFGRTFGFDSVIAAPMVREDKVVGAIVTAHRDAIPFDDKQVALIRTFADQAVIAIENARLVNETREALEQQTATSEILRVISSSPTDVQPVFDAIAACALRLFDGMSVAVMLIRGDRITLAASAGDDEVRRNVEKEFPIPLDRQSITGRTIADQESLSIPDMEAPELPEYSRALARKAGVRAIVSAPMVREGASIGAIVLSRRYAGAFSDKQVALLRTFADQAVIAIENVRLFREIQEKSAQLEVANKHKSDFLANMSHELRTPLNAIIGFSEVLGERYFGELTEKQDEYVKDIHSSGKHLLSLINDILDLSKIEAGRMELDLGEFDLPAALENAMTLVKERAQRHGVALKLEAAAGLGAFTADERKFKQIMLNLLSNAVKFTPVGGSVTVSAKPNGRGVEIAVADTGVGIAAEDQEAVFEEFRQVGRDVSKKAEGTGLGLALTRRFVELHGGEIRLESAPGKGSTFTFTIPGKP
jgi:signal transduction histidine kinase